MIQSSIANIINYVLPHRCMSCNELTQSSYALCSCCFKQLEFITDPQCEICGVQFELDIYQGCSCTKCLNTPPNYDIARSIFKFNPVSKKLIHDFKYNDKTSYAKFFAKLLVNKYLKLINEVDYIIPVPMHYIKRLYRFYNPPYLLAKEIAKYTDPKKLRPDLLIKTKLTKTQTSLTKEQRYQNLQDSITVSNKYKIEGKNILLIDDVHTTGATANYCSYILKSHKASRVNFLSASRT